MSAEPDSFSYWKPRRTGVGYHDPATKVAFAAHNARNASQTAFWRLCGLYLLILDVQNGDEDKAEAELIRTFRFSPWMSVTSPKATARKVREHVAGVKKYLRTKLRKLALHHFDSE